MGKDRLEDYIKEQLVNHESTVDSDAVWNRLQKNKKKKRGFLWLPVLGLIIVAGLIGIYLISQESNELDLKNKKIILAEKKVISKTNVSEEVSSSSQSEGGTNNKNIEVDKASETSVESITTRKTQSRLTNVNRDKPNVNSSSVLQAEENVKLNASNGLLATQDFKGQKSLITANVEQQSNRSLIKSSIVNFNSTSSFNTDLLGKLELSLLNYKRELDVQKLDKSPLFNDEKNSDTWQSYIGVSTAYYKGSRTLKSLDSIDTTLNLRTAGEDFLEAWGVGLEYLIKHKSGLFFGTGLAYGQINDRSIIEEQSRELLVPTPAEFQGQGVFAQITDVERVRYHKIGMIDIPLFVGYKFQKGNNAFSLQTGININLRTYSRGQIINAQLQDNEEYTAVFRGVEDEVLFRNRVGWSSQIEFGYHRLINDSFELAIKPTFRYYSSSFNYERNNLIEQRYKHIGLKMTLSKRF